MLTLTLSEAGASPAGSTPESLLIFKGLFDLKTIDNHNLICYTDISTEKWKIVLLKGDKK